MVDVGFRADLIVNLLVYGCAPAWSTHLSYGKIFAPELQGESLEYLLSILKPNKVVGVRKLLSDSAKSHIPLFVLTFLSSTPPTKIQIGYCYVRVDKYYPNPLRCGQCCRYGHSRARCSNKLPSCSHCSKMGHTRESCTDINLPPKCLNCKGPHDATSRQCPKYLAEVRACHLTADEGLSFAAARAQIQAEERNPDSSATMPRNPASTTPLHNSNNHQNNSPTTAPHNLDLNSLKAFPTLTQLIAEDSSSYIPPYQIPPNEPSWNRGPPSTPRTHNPPTQAPSSSLPPLHHSLTQTPSHNTNPNKIGTQSKSLNNNNADQLPHAFKHDQVHNCPITASHAYTQHTTTTPHPPTNHTADILQIITKLVPIIIRLFFSTQITDKAKCFLEIGHLLHADSTVVDSLAQFGLTSISQ
ncbi:uncharacterized protein LOC108672199 [Hyalella azteca]|uniref:Uncharacterized protein LOC108672199 n=1 Tax=Hyalella azteca TaxID=294128 RepID=A0A8B7NQE2_HYAAZ|nr:uncharacterized protein LOC108672199 [Hyalella azteca]